MQPAMKTAGVCEYLDKYLLNKNYRELFFEYARGSAAGNK
jgi:hypothetical protein